MLQGQGGQTPHSSGHTRACMRGRGASCTVIPSTARSTAAYLHVKRKQRAVHPLLVPVLEVAHQLPEFCRQSGTRCMRVWERGGQEGARGSKRQEQSWPTRGQLEEGGSSIHSIKCAKQAARAMRQQRWPKRQRSRSQRKTGKQSAPATAVGPTEEGRSRQSKRQGRWPKRESGRGSLWPQHLCRARAAA
jgi:hypothetical protein